MNRIASVVLLSMLTWLLPGAALATSKRFVPDVSKNWSEIDPALVYPDFTYQGLRPSCAAPPPTQDPQTGDIIYYDSEFTFFVKGGTRNNLLIYFEGGGACWDSINCLYARAYKEEGTALSSLLQSGAGIFDFDNPANPFRDWYIVYIPYCTGDVHWGANDVAYPDVAGAYGGQPQTLRHRGYVNFQAVLEWVKDNFYAPWRVFVTGSSAGAYGATLGFPAIREAFPWSKVDVLGDAGNGVTSPAFLESIVAWNVQVPTWIPGLEQGYTPALTFGQLNQAIADYYRFSNVAQFTTAWDGVQTNFYYITNNISTPETWESEWPSAWCDWNSQMVDQIRESTGSNNFRYYISAGTYHTVLATPNFYEEDTLGVPLRWWVRQIVRSYPVFGFPNFWLPNIECEDCADPIPCD